MKIQRTYLTVDGRKADVDPQRACLIATNDHMGAAVPIYTTNDLSSIAVGEGAETMIAVWQATELPTAACCDAGNLERYTPPTTTKTLYVAVDNDKSRRGEQAYHSLSAVLCRTRPDVRVVPVMPPAVGTDWADYPQQEVRKAWRAAMSRSAAPDWEVYL